MDENDQHVVKAALSKWEYSQDLFNFSSDPKNPKIKNNLKKLGPTPLYDPYDQRKE